MPSFDFSVVKIKKEKVIKQHKHVEDKYEVIKKKIDTYIQIDLEANYYVIVDDIRYNIVPEDYSCKDVEQVYLQKLDKLGHRMRWDRIGMNLQALGKQYLPFAPGIKVHGHIVKNIFNNEQLFHLIKILPEDLTIEGYEILKYYKENYDIIQQNMKNK